MSNVYPRVIWNEFDEKALLVGFRRIPTEKNIELRNRILNHATYNSTAQGMLNNISESLLKSSYNITPRMEFFSTFQPLSFAIYQSIPTPDLPFYPPTITAGGTVWTIASSSDDQKDQVTKSSVTWYLWKQPDGSYDRVWTTNVSAQDDVDLRYMYQDTAGVLHLVHETSLVSMWVSGQIVPAHVSEAS